MLSEIYFQKPALALFHEYINRYIDLLEELETSGERFGMFIFQTTGFKWLAYLYRACAWLDQGHPEKGKQELERSMLLAPDKAHYHHLLAGYYKQRNQYKESTLEFEKALEVSPADIEILWDFAQLQKQRGKTAEARGLFERMIQAHPKHKNALFELGNMHLTNHDLDRAVEYYQRIIQIDNHHTSAKVNMALALRKMGRFELSIPYSLDVLKERPSSLESLSNLAYAYHDLGNDKKAVEYFMKITQFHPDQLDPYVYLALIFLSNNTMDSCIRSCDYLLKLLDLERNIVLNSFKDLGDRFFAIAHRLSDLNHSHLSNICLQIGQILDNADSPAQS
jgi:tetratricopeptide (TPR) repeat protein